MITRLDDDLADALKRRARTSGESVNGYVTRLLRAALGAPSAAPASARQMWKAAALADGRLVKRGLSTARSAGCVPYLPGSVTPAGYAVQALSDERDDR